MPLTEIIKELDMVRDEKAKKYRVPHEKRWYYLLVNNVYIDFNAMDTFQAFYGNQRVASFGKNSILDFNYEWSAKGPLVVEIITGKPIEYYEGVTIRHLTRDILELFEEYDEDN